MKFIPSSLIATAFVFLSVQIGIITGLIASNRLPFRHPGSYNHSNFTNNSTTGSNNTIQFHNSTDKGNNSYPIKRLFYIRNDRQSDVGFNLSERASRHKRDIRTDMLENELQLVLKTYNSEVVSQSKSAMNSMLSRSEDLNGLRNLLAFSFNNLATNGFNDLSSMASKLPITAQNCYNSYGFKFSQVIGISKMMASQCLTNKINEAKSIAEDFKSSITDAVGNLKDVADQITQCRMLANLYPSIAGLIARASCLNIAIFSIRGETVLLPLKFATLIGKSFNSVLTIQSDMTRCGLEILNTILDQSIQSGKAINNCINEQNGTTNSTSFTVMTTAASY